MFRVQKFISLIAASIILAAPNIHAMAGYNFYFGKPKTESVPFDECISSMLPQKLRLSQEYRDEIKYMKEKTGITTPIICVKSSPNAPFVGATRNYGVGPLRFAILQLNEEDMNDRYGNFNTHTIAHELTHVERNHGGVINTAPLGVIPAVEIWCMASFSKWIPAGMPRVAPADLKNGFGKIKKSAALGAAGLALTLVIGAAYAKYTSIRSQWETEAEEGAVEKLSKLGYCKALEEEFLHYKQLQLECPKSTRIKGNMYPTLGEYIAMAEKAYIACKGINPAERPDTPNLMRNGTPVVTWTQWFSSFFGGGK